LSSDGFYWAISDPNFDYGFNLDGFLGSRHSGENRSPDSL
jgi:hypothetical protein